MEHSKKVQQSTAMLQDYKVFNYVFDGEVYVPQVWYAGGRGSNPTLKKITFHVYFVPTLVFVLYRHKN